MGTPFMRDAQTGPSHTRTVGHWLPGGDRCPLMGRGFLSGVLETL